MNSPLLILSTQHKMNLGAASRQPLGTQRGTQRGNQWGNQWGIQRGNQRGNQWGNQRGNQRGSQLGNLGLVCKSFAETLIQCVFGYPQNSGKSPSQKI